MIGFILQFSVAKFGGYQGLFLIMCGLSVISIVLLLRFKEYSNWSMRENLIELDSMKKE